MLFFFLINVHKHFFKIKKIIYSLNYNSKNYNYGKLNIYILCYIYDVIISIKNI